MRVRIDAWDGQLAEQLLDHWGTAMAYGGIARSQLALGDYDKANAAALKAIQFNARLRLRRSEISALMTCGEARQKLNLPDAGVGHYRKAWELLTEDDPKELRQQALKAFVVALESVGRAEEAAKHREDNAALLSDESAG